MSIRLKIVLIVLPLIIATLALTGVSGYFSASNGITRIAKDFLDFKSQELQTQSQSQWGLLVDNNLTGKPGNGGGNGGGSRRVRPRHRAKRHRGDLCVSGRRRSGHEHKHGCPQPGEKEKIAELATGKRTDLVTVAIGGKDRIAKGFWFDPFGWYVMVSEERAAFYSPINEIALRTLIILAVSILAGVILVLIFSSYLTRPLRRVVTTMKDIISTNDLSERVLVEYKDEIGQLAQTFNIMVNGLEEAYRQIKAYALKAAVARTRERKIKEIFRQYVPEDVINAVQANESKVSGDQGIVSVLFSHIVNYDEVVTGLRPDELVQTSSRTIGPW